MTANCLGSQETTAFIEYACKGNGPENQMKIRKEIFIRLSSLTLKHKVSLSLTLFVETGSFSRLLNVIKSVSNTCTAV